MTFADDLWDGFPTVEQKTAEGFRLAKDMAVFYKKLAEIEEQYSKALLALVNDKHKSRLRRFFRSASSSKYDAGSLRDACIGAREAVERWGETHAQHSAELLQRAHAPLVAWLAEHEGKRKQAAEEGRRAHKELTHAVERVAKTRASYCAKVRGAQLATDTEYRDSVAVHNRVQANVNGVVMPRVLHKLERIERDRGQALRKSLDGFGRALAGVGAAAGALEQTAGALKGGVDVAADLSSFVAEHMTSMEPPPPLEVLPYDPAIDSVEPAVPASAPRVAKMTTGFKAGLARFKKTASSAMQKNSAADAGRAEVARIRPRSGLQHQVFHVGLAEVMRVEGRNAATEAPNVFVTLLDAVRFRGGVQTEGIFRIPASANEIKRLVKQFNSGSYELPANGDAHVPACLLKLWMRELAEPLVPSEWYAQAIAAAGHAQESVRVFDSLPPLNKRIIGRVVLLMQEIAAPNNAAVNKMSVDALTVVFTPSFLRSPSAADDGAIALFDPDMDAQFAFVGDLITNLGFDAATLRVTCHDVFAQGPRASTGGSHDNALQPPRPPPKRKTLRY